NRGEPKRVREPSLVCATTSCFGRQLAIGRNCEHVPSPYLNSERASASLPCAESGFWLGCVVSEVLAVCGLSFLDQGVNLEIKRLPSESFCATATEFFELPVGLSYSYGELVAANVSASTHLTVGRAARSAAFTAVSG